MPRPAAPLFPTDAPVLVTPTRGAALSAYRFKTDIPESGEIDITMPLEDAFLVLYQLRDHPAHELCLDGRLRCIGPTPRHTLNIIDLNRSPHGWMRQPVDTLMLHLPRDALDEIAEAAGAPKVDRLVATDSWQTTDPVLDGLHRPVVAALTGGAPVNRLLQDHLLHAIGAHVATAYGGMRPHDLIRGGLAPWQQRRAEELLAANLSGDLPLLDVAGECGLSLAYFSRAFKRSTGMTPHSWLQQRRIDTAKHLLADRALPLADVALACGFADQSHFTRIFARLAGATPGAWRRLH